MNHTLVQNKSRGCVPRCRWKNSGICHFAPKGNVYTEIFPDCTQKTLQAIIRGKVEPDSVIHPNSWRGYNGLIDLGYKKYYRVRHSNVEIAKGKKHINGIESFWSSAKRRLIKFYGIPKSTFYLHLEESEFQFNNRNTDFGKVFVNNFRSKTLFQARH